MSRFNRVLLKLSGEALKGDLAFGYQPEAISDIVERISKVVRNGVEVAIVVGAGNLWRGLAGSSSGMDRVRADHMGMLATMMNALALKEYFEQSGVPALVQSAFGVEGMLPRYDRDTAVAALESGRVVIFAGGTGNPFFTTDTASVVRALEINCDAVLKATKVDGVYSADPFKDPDAVRYEEISFDEAIEKRLKVMDASAFSLCRDNNLAIIVFDFAAEESLERVVAGDTSCGTIVS
ncbi:MAG: UMP kinase [Lentisphaeria bacterium]|nr:UMP kinase [Lentisphaeria bacterium]